MSYQRVQNVLYHAPAHVRGTERLALTIIADAIPGTDPDRTVSIGRDDFAQALAVAPKQVRQVLSRLAEQKVEVRVEVSESKDGRAVYAHRGSVARYQLPWFEAPDGCRCEACHKGAVTAAPKSREKGPSARPQTPDKGAAETAPNARKGPREQPKGAVYAAPLPVPDVQPELLDVGKTPGEAPSEPALTVDERAAKRDERAQRNGALFATPQRISEPLQVVLDALADDNATIDEARQVQKAWIAAASPNGIGLYRVVAEQGGIPWRSNLASIRAAAKVETAVQIAKLKRGPRCPHGDPGGDQPHPGSGEALCASCRHGLPAAETSGPQPVETYRRLFLAAHNERPAMPLMSAVARQRHDLATRGVDARALDALAAAAALSGHDLVTELRTQKERASA